VRLYEVIWKDKFVDKIEREHNVITYEIDQVLFSNPHIRRAEKGKVKGEDLYVAYGQTKRGRYLAALTISAGNMTISERRYYEKQKKAS
jgi:hypothetical protein